MRSDFRLQKLILLLILSFSTLSGCIGLPSESDPSPTPETPVSNEQSQASGAEGSNSSDAAPNSSPTQEPTELEKKWDEFLMALSINITNESPENFKAVQTKAQELKELAKIPPDLAGLRTYLQDAIIYYPGQEPIQQTFNNELVKDGLGFRDLAIGDPNTLLSDENKQSTAQQVVDKLDNKYRSLLTTTQETNQTNNTQETNQTNNTQETNQTNNTQETNQTNNTQETNQTNNTQETNLFYRLIFVVLVLGAIAGVVIFINKQLKIYPPLNNFMFKQKLTDPNSSEITQTGTELVPKELEKVMAIAKGNKHSINELKSLPKEVENLKQQVEKLTKDIKRLTQQLETSNTNRTGSFQVQEARQQNSFSTQTQLKSSAIPASSIQQTTENFWKQMIAQSTPVEDTNPSSRRMGSGEFPFFMQTPSRQALLGIYQNSSGQYLLLPRKSRTDHERLSSYFDLKGSFNDGEVEVIEPAIVIPSGQGWELDQKGVVEFR